LTDGNIGISRQPMAEGKVKWFNEQRGFGHIEKVGGGEVFFFQTAIQEAGIKKLSFGQRVSFDIVQGPTGTVAENIKLL